jgi:hypothetical protein
MEEEEEEEEEKEEEEEWLLFKPSFICTPFLKPI